MGQKIMQLNIEQKLKERLVGMGVLVFLGIIVIPWILDGERPDELNADKRSQALLLPSPDGLKTRDINLQDGSIKVVNMKTPERVKMKADTDSTSVSNASQSQTKTGASETQLKSSQLKQQQATQAVDKVATVKRVNAKTKEPASTLKVSKESVSQLKPKATPPIAPVKTSSATATERATIAMQEQVMTDPVSTWTVQMGSFGDKANAERLMKQLNEKDFPAFVNRYQNDAGKVLFRVRVGTEKDRARADKLLARLAKSDFKGKVLTHP